MIVNKPHAPGDFHLEVALGNISGYKSVNKFGEAPDCDTGVTTDLWDGADGVTSTDAWVRPTAARIHQLSSASANDTGAGAGGTGARTIKVYGLTAWTDTAETIETLTLLGATDVPTANAYVIIYRMHVVTAGILETNDGIITAVADTDSTITAMIRVNFGQTLMAIYGIPTGQSLAIESLHTGMLANSSANSEGRLVVITDPAGEAAQRTLRTWAFRRDSRYIVNIDPPLVIRGPAILKIQVITDAVNVVCVGDFDAVQAPNDNA